MICLVLQFDITVWREDIDDLPTPFCFSYWTVFCIAFSYLFRSLIYRDAPRLSGCSDMAGFFLLFLNYVIAILINQTNKTMSNTMRIGLLVIFKNSMPWSRGGKRREIQAYLKLLINSGSCKLQRMVQGKAMIIYVLLVNSESIINMFLRQIYNKALLPYTHNKNLFSKIRKRPHRQATLKQKEQMQFSIEDYINYNYEYFDCFESLKKIHNAYTRSLQHDKLLEAKQLYDKMDQQCTQLLREQNQKLIIKISQGQICYEDLKKLLNLKVFMQLRFRKWDDMVLDLHNYIQALKYENQDQKIAEKMAVQSYHKFCAIFIMNDHDQLYDLFDYQLKFTPERKRKLKDTSDKIRPFGFGFDTYHKVQIEVMNIPNPTIQSSEVLLLQGMGLLVLGRKEIGLRKLSVLTGLNFSNEIRQQAFISILTSLSFPSKGSKAITQKQIENIKKARTITLFDAKQLAESRITVQQCEQILNQLLLAFYKKDISKLSITVLKKYFNILALICQNYYIEGKENDYNRLNTLLKSKRDEHLNFMLSYFEIARYVDKNDIDNAQTLFKETKDFDEELKDGMRQFYRPDKIVFDLLRVNIYKLGSRIYELKGNEQQFQQYMQQAALLQCKLGAFTIKQPSESILQGNELTVDWRNTVSGRVPYHYLNLRLQKILGVDEDIFEQTPF